MSSPSSDGRRMGGRFVIEREVGRGGAGVVYRAWDIQSDQNVALKVIAAEAGVEPGEEERLTREGEILSKLDHPGIVKTVAWGVLEDSGLPFVAMEWLTGEDLAQRQQRRPLGVAASTWLAADVADSLAAAHGAGVIHRDVKPGNIFLARKPRPEEEGPVQSSGDDLTSYRPKLVDFGVAARDTLSTTRAGDLVGTPAYMAPEQARGDAKLDVRCDIYSLGATLFELVAGRPPHVGPSSIATLARLVTTPAPRLSDIVQLVPPSLDRLVQDMLETDPRHRPGSAQEVSEALRDAAEDAGRSSWFGDTPRSVRLGTSASRLITSIVALHFEKSSDRERAIELLRQRGADPVPLGRDAIVGHLGARHAVGSEASAALDLGRRLARVGAQVGIASGRARVSTTGDQVRPVGEVVDRASALAREARHEQVLADVTTTELGRGRYEFRARDDGSAFVGEQVRGAKDRTGGAPFVGREPEMAQIHAAVQRSVSDETPVVVTVTGPPGIGKTRLRREVLSRLSTISNAPDVVVQRSEAYGRSHVLGAAADVIRAMIDLPKGATAQEADTAIIARLGPATRDELTSKNRKLLARLIANDELPEGVDPRGARDALWLAMTDVVIQVASNQPTVLCMEDLQWADAESIGWLDHLLGRAVHKPLVVFPLVRPGFWSDYPNRFQGRDHVRLELRPLSLQSCRTIAETLIGSGASAEQVDLVATRAGGLPLFAEELSRLTAAGRDTSHAPTIQAAIQASLDTLDEECRDAVGRLSVFGLTAWDAGLEALGMVNGEGLMRSLAAAEVLIEQSTTRFSGSREWQFKHALVRDVAYEALGDDQRKELHALAGPWLASMGEDAAVVARHLDLGGVQDAASEYWARAAQRALATNALNDAVEMAERALAFAGDRPTGFTRASYLDEAWSRLDPRSSERATAIEELKSNVHDEASGVRADGASARYDDARGQGMDIDRRLEEARDAAARLQLHDEEARCTAALASRHAFAGDLARAKNEAQRLLEFGSRGLLHAAVDGWQSLAIVHQTKGEVSKALAARRSAAETARKAGLKEREAMLTTNLGFALTTIGARQEARNALETGLALADAIGSTGAVRHAQMNLLGWTATFGNDRGLDGYLAETRAAADAAATGYWTAPDRSNLGALFYRGWELLRSPTSSRELSRALLKMTAEAYRNTGNRDVLPVALGVWAEAERICGEEERAIELASEAAELLEGGAPSLLNESPVYLVLHDGLREMKQDAEARDAVRRGMPWLVRRVRGLTGTPYARQFLTDLPYNAGLLAIAETYGLVPDEIHRVLER